ncbi:hypothetical protein, partial [Pseudomonas lundensis]|uniref:hypothetical protein n=1 Tax=Pseudomonas lundensis TaxID=86185 RepID=UPI001CB7173E
YEVSSLAFEFSGKDTTLLGHLTPRYGEHSRLNECPVSLDHYTRSQNHISIAPLAGLPRTFTALEGRSIT